MGLQRETKSKLKIFTSLYKNKQLFKAKVLQIQIKTARVFHTQCT